MGLEEKKQQIHRAQLNIQKMEIKNLHYNDLDVIAEGYGVIGHLSSTKEDCLVNKYLDGKVPFLPPVVTMFEKVTPKLEHGVVSLVQLLQAVIKMMCIQPAFEEHIVWFMSETGTMKENHIEMVSYSDAYTIQGMLATTMLTIVLFNVPWLVHIF